MKQAECVEKRDQQRRETKASSCVVRSSELQSSTPKQRPRTGSNRNDNSAVPTTDKEICRSRKNIDSSSVVVGPCVDWKLPTFTGNRKRRQTSSTSRGAKPRDWTWANICRFVLNILPLGRRRIRPRERFRAENKEL